MNNISDPSPQSVDALWKTIQVMQCESIILILALHNTIIVTKQNEKIARLEEKGKVNTCTEDEKVLVSPELKNYCSGLVNSYMLGVFKTLNSAFHNSKPLNTKDVVFTILDANNYLQFQKEHQKFCSDLSTSFKFVYYP